MERALNLEPKKRKWKPPGGSRKGSPNRTTIELKEMVLAALDKAGGVDYLVRQAEKCPQAFLTLVGKVLPFTITGANGGPLELSVVNYSEVGRIIDGKVIDNALEEESSNEGHGQRAVN